MADVDWNLLAQIIEEEVARVTDDSLFIDYEKMIANIKAKYDAKYA